MHIEEVALGIELAQLKRRALRVLIRLAENTKDPKEARLLCALIIRAQPTNFQPEMKVNNYTAKLAIELPTLDPNEEEFDNENETTDEPAPTAPAPNSPVPRPSPSPNQPGTPPHHGEGRAPSPSVPTPTPTPSDITTPTPATSTLNTS